MFEIRRILGLRGLPALGPIKARALTRPGRLALVGCCSAALLVLSGCGQKGPLYLPGHQASTSSATAPSTAKPLR
ncbi:LPS translocon maturation chaperone LptM [Malikia spinosa]|uniref:LPS translocon maturation chaperone LptM n=1 Tax=Malikia spinosa TaxID=86180 RepID=UPI003FA2CFD8